MGGADHAQSAAPSADVGNPFESAGISPTAPFTHPDMSSTMGEGGEDALGSTPWPDHTEEGNGRLNAAEDTNYTADENKPGHVHAPNTEHTFRLTHTERGGQPGHDSPDPYADFSESSRNPADANNAGTDRPGHRGEHIEVDPNDPNADTFHAADANSRAHADADEDGNGLGDSSDLNRRNGHPSDVSGTDGIVTNNKDNKNCATDAQSNDRASDAGGDHSTTTRADDGGVPYYENRGDSLPTARRPPTGERVEPVARRMRANGPLQQ